MSLTSEEQAAFAQSVGKVRQATAAYLGMHRDERSAVAFAGTLHRSMDHAINGAVLRGARVDCKPGCSYCCHARVEATAPEVFRIAAQLDRLPASERAAKVDRLRAHVDAPEGAETSWRRRKACPFLENHLCSIHELRPAACRKAHSTDVGRCEAAAPVIPQDLGIALDCEALVSGTSEGYRESGFDAAGYELVRSVLVALGDPTAQFRWHGGERVFEVADPQPSISRDR